MASETDVGAGEALAPGYPPRRHLLRDLGLWVEAGPSHCRAGIPIVESIRTSSGNARAGAVATLVDVVAGALATRVVAPDWLATCDLVLHLLGAASKGELIAEARVLRRGRSTVVIECEVHCGEAGAPIALGTVTFSILESRSDIQQVPGAESDMRSEFRLADSGLRDPLASHLGILPAPDGRDGEWQIRLSPYNVNTLGALQGGGLATLIDLAIESAGRQHGDAGWITTDFAIHFLSLGKVGPLVTSTRLLRGNPQDALARVEVWDSSDEPRLVAVATGTCEPLS